MKKRLTGLAFLLVVLSLLAGTSGIRVSGAEIPEPAPDAFESYQASGSETQIDKLVFANLKRMQIKPVFCSDAVFLRRAYLDVIGTLPTAQEARAFLSDPDEKNRRRRLIDRLLERPEFADYWSMKWGDVLRIKAEFPVNLWPEAAEKYHQWVRSAIAENMPYDKFVRELLTASGSNFRNGPVNFYRAVQNRTPEGIAAAVALTFMGTRLETWQPAAAGDLAAFFCQVGYKPTREWKEEIVFWDPLKSNTGSNPAGTPAAAQPAVAQPAVAQPAVTQLPVTQPATIPPATAQPATSRPATKPLPNASRDNSPDAKASRALPAKVATGSAPATMAAATLKSSSTSQAKNPDTARPPGTPELKKPAAPAPAATPPAPPVPTTSITTFAAPPAPPPILNSQPLEEATFPDGVKVRLSPDKDPREVFADWLTRPKNHWLKRAIVNRIWYWLLGRGIIQEPDDIRPDNPPSNPALAAYLEHELVSSHFDLKRIYKLILNSQTYQLSSMPRFSGSEAEASFASYPLRRLDAEVLIDAINKITGTSDRYTSPIPEPFTYIPEDMPAIAIGDGSITSPFLTLFGRSARSTGMAGERNYKPLPSQSLHMLNSSHIQRKLETGAGIKAIIDSGHKPPTIVEDLYLTILSRLPTTRELNEVMAYGGADQASPPPGRGVALKNPGAAQPVPERNLQIQPRNTPVPAAPVLKQRRDWVDIAWALINSSEFLYKH